MAVPEPEPPGRLVSHFCNRSNKQQSAGWTELWDTDQSDLWDRGKPSPALIEFIESKPQVLSNITNKHRPKVLVPGCGKGYDVVALALHGFDAYGLEVSEKGAATARQHAASELAEPSEYNYHDLNAWPAGDAGDVTIIAGDFFQPGWEPAVAVFCKHEWVKTKIKLATFDANLDRAQVESKRQGLKERLRPH